MLVETVKGNSVRNSIPFPTAPEALDKLNAAGAQGNAVFTIPATVILFVVRYTSSIRLLSNLYGRLRQYHEHPALLQ